jgi:hypothetical protein
MATVITTTPQQPGTPPLLTKEFMENQAYSKLPDYSSINPLKAGYIRPETGSLQQPKL